MNLRSSTLPVAMTSVLMLVGGLIHQAGAWIQKDVTIEKNDDTAAIECSGNSVVVRGDDNKLTIKGECNRLTVSGDDNVISATTAQEVEVTGSDNTITVGTVGRISTTGDDNKIKWTRGVSGKAPVVSLKGNDNKIDQAGK